MEAIITAGGIPEPKDPLYTLTQGGYKAMLEVGGKTMIRRVLDAVSASRHVERIIVIGLPLTADLPCSKPLVLLPGQGSMTDNIRFAAADILQRDPNAQNAILFASDTPAITTPMVDWMAETVQAIDADILYTVIERSVMEGLFPGSRRSYTHLKDHEYCGGDAIGIKPTIATNQNPIWDRLTAARKNSFKQAALLGYDTLFMLMLRQVTLSEAAAMVSRRLGIRGAAIACPYAEMGMDVDKPHQLELVRALIASRKEARA